jgi:hypothetical protein
VATPLIPRDMAVPALQGPVGGVRWVVGASNHGCWLGSLEAELQHALWGAIPVGGCFYDVGANADSTRSLPRNGSAPPGGS